MKNKYLTKGVCVCVGGGGTVGNYCPGVNVFVDEKVGNMARVWDSEGLGNRTKKTYVYFTL